MLLKIIKVAVALVVVAIAAFLAWNYFAGPLKDRRDFRELGASIANCEPYTQTVRYSNTGERLTNDVLGEDDDGQCVVHLQSAGTEVIRCTLKREQWQILGESYAGYAENIGFFGGYRFRYSSSEPDPFSAILNSTACVSD